MHAAQIQKLKDMINEKYPKLDVDLPLMSLHGKVNVIQQKAQVDHRLEGIFSAEEKMLFHLAAVSFGTGFISETAL